MPCLPKLLAAALALATVVAAAQPAAPLVPLTRASVEPALARELGIDVAPLGIRGELDLDGKQFYIAEYQVLVEVSGEFSLPVVDGMAFGLPVWGERVRLQYSARHDVAALQMLVDRAWADLRKRLADADLQVAPAAEMIARHGAVFSADQPASTAAAPVLAELRSGDRVRRYLVFAPTGMKIVERSLTGLSPANLAARAAWPAKKVEALSLALAVNLTGLDGAQGRASTFVLPNASPAGLKPISPFMEVRPAPGLALVQTHAAAAQVELNEAAQLAGEFARLRPVSGARAEGEPLPVWLELDGPSSARLMILGIEAANEAITLALERAVTPLAQRP